MKVLYFAWVRDFVGTGQETVEPPAEVATVGDLMGWLAQRSPGHARAFADPAVVRCAVDQDFAGAEAPIAGVSEVAFFPPVTGG
ncbi:molybdopterin converting factor subunit 1 [uncultured Rhodospira sp.]|uniref:molybdopterin converting factor subunit 1 n=1 Tax=uncultured Rhodospira sp. TaxID=1936189 RepID=UPI0026109490|nr:molybdopterin converting factor subunit 1 [uncultured Rhodospira sp.]